VLRWASTLRLPNGQRWLEYHPLLGVRRSHEKKPKRPVATWDRFQKVQAAIQQEAANAKAKDQPDVYIRWTSWKLALVLAESTGRRIGSIRQLRWEDIDLNGSNYSLAC